MARKTTSRNKDITTLLKKDHNTVKALFSQFDETNDRALKKKQALAETICEELEMHARLEEEIFYPAIAELRSKDAKRLVAEAHEEHALVKQLVSEIEDGEVGSTEWNAKVKVLKDLVLHHAKEEESEIFEEVREGLDKEELEELGARFETRKEALQHEPEEEEARARFRGEEAYGSA